MNNLRFRPEVGCRVGPGCLRCFFSKIKMEKLELFSEWVKKGMDLWMYGFFFNVFSVI